MPNVIMPKMGDAMEEGTLLRWLKQVGDEIAVGDPLAEIETDKVSLEIEATEAGVLSKTLVEEGATVPIGTPIAAIGEEGTDAAASAQPAEAAEEAEEAPPTESAPAAEVEPVAAAASGANGRAAADVPAPGQATPVAATAASGERLRASPLVKRLAAEHGIDLSSVTGTGPGGRIVRDDIAALLTGAPRVSPAPDQAVAPAPAQAPAAAPPVLTPGPSGRPAGVPRELSKIRRTTGRRMAESKAAAPHFYVTSEVDMAPAAALREQINAQAPDDAAKVSFNDLIIKAAALALREYPNLNASLENDQLVEHPNIDINVAVAIEDGLIAPFVPDADQKGLITIARMTKDLVGRARNGGLTPDVYQGGTFTVSNLGMFDVGEFIAIINPPQAAILAIGSIMDVPVVEDGVIVPGKR
ncbi:MAG: catalytic domain of component of various dehydrogenase complexe, partial [Thermomicrobiales bacterium]|nr:catalytic domain of component of various dehydrogenase complexe [Thermomicrobiales bacterium]